MFMRWIGAALLAATLPLRAGVIVIRNVNVVSMRDARVDAAQTVIIRDDRIESVGTADSIPAGATIIEGNGRWLMPGLIDSHVHIRAADLPRYLAHGVTTVRDMAGLDSVLEIARAIDRGELQGPAIVTSTLLINGPNPNNPQFSTVITSASQADAIVAAQLARGVVFVKLYENLSLAMYDALVHAARARGARIAGHVSAQVDVRHAIESQDSIEHLSGYERALSASGAWETADRSRYAELARISAEKGVWNCPTLYVYSVLFYSAALVENRRAFVRELHAQGAHLLAGTDAGYYFPGGASLLEELRELVASGLTPYEALTAATRDAAQFLGIDEIGTIEAGKRADLILLDANPLDGVDALVRPVEVFVRGVPVMPIRRRAAQNR
jgi:imidazolonepropionase-like amidohydrolase